jgi:HEAT repeat protein
MNLEEYRKRVGERVAQAQDERLDQLDKLEAVVTPAPAAPFTPAPADAFTKMFVNAGGDVAEAGLVEHSERGVGERERALALGALQSDDAPLEQRVEALRIGVGALGQDEEGVLLILDVLRDERRPLELRREALNAIQRLRFTSMALREHRPAVVDALHVLLTDADNELRVTAVEVLAQEKDEEVQLRLLEGLTGSGEPLVEPELAIQLLGYDVHAGHLRFLRTVVRTSENQSVRQAAVRVLAADPGAAGLLAEVLGNPQEDEGVRRAAAAALRGVAPVDFEQVAREIVLKDDHPGLRATLLAGLGRVANPASLGADRSFIERVERMMDDVDASLELRSAAQEYTASKIKRS